MIECSVGVMAYNEEGNIDRLLGSVLRQKSDRVRVTEILVVASGCTDGTARIVRSFLETDSRIRLLIQPEREGKISAIKLFLSRCRSNIVMIVNGDLRLDENVADRLAGPFQDPQVGMTGGRAVSENDPGTFMGFLAHFLWDMHHEISLRFPKLGELVAYRKIPELSFPDDTADDEGIIEALMTRAGYHLQYVPEAVCYNRGPVVLSEYLKRRINIFAGHIQLKRRNRYTPSTMDPMKLMITLWPKVASLAFRDVRSFVWTVGAVLLELYARFMACVDFYVLRTDLSRWEIAQSARTGRKCPD